MRRYIDIINHRIISNIYCGTNFIVDYDTNNEKFIEELNIEHKKIKKINLLSQLYVNIFDINFKECDIYNGIIIGFNNNKLKVYIKDFGIINIVLFNKQFNNLYEYIIEDDKYILYNKETNNKTIYSLNQQICVKIGITKLSRKKINATLFL
jgi:exoribonuclease R